MMGTPSVSASADDDPLLNEYDRWEASCKREYQSTGKKEVLTGRESVEDQKKHVAHRIRLSLFTPRLQSPTRVGWVKGV
jgi:hypothetical protein